MSVTPTANVVGVFTDRSAAEQAMEALYNAGFEHESVHYSASGSPGGFFDDLKSLFTGTNTNASNLANDLTTMGLSDEEVQYYADEYVNGNTILVVRAPNREREALSILYQYGAYGTGANAPSSNGTINPVQQSPDYTQPNVVEQHDPQNWQEQPQPQVAGEHFVDDHQQEIVIPEENVDTQTERPAMPTYSSEQQSPAYNVMTPEQEAENQAAQNSTGLPENATEDRTTQPMVPEDTAEPGNLQEDRVVVPEQKTTDPAALSDGVTPGPTSETQPVQAGGVVPEYTNKLQRLQQRLQSTQQQLQDAKARLQAAKQHESQLQSSRQQLQELQTELQATQAELQETQTRIEQY